MKNKSIIGVGIAESAESTLQRYNYFFIDKLFLEIF